MNNMIQLQQNGGSMKFARKIQFLKNMYVDDEDFRDKLANEGIISEDDMINSYIDKGEYGLRIEESVTPEECVYIVSDGIELVVSIDRYEEWINNDIIKKVK